MNIKKYLFFVCLVCICLFGLSLNMVQADEVEINQSNSISYRYDDDSSWSSISGASELVNGHTYQVRFQFTPFYSFLDSHYYKLRLIFNHNAGTYTFDYANFYNSSYQGVQYDTSTYSATFNNIDATHCQLILDGVRDVDVNRQIQRLRFFFNDTVAIDSGYNSASIRINDVHLFVSDVTEAYILPQIDDKLDSTNAKLDEGNQKKQTIIDRITNLPNALKDMLVSIFVPSSSDLSDIFDDFNDLLEDRFGGLYQVFEYCGDFAGIFVSGESSGTFHVPRLEITVPVLTGGTGNVGFHRLLLTSETNIDILPSIAAFNTTYLNAIKFGIDILAIIAVFRFFMSVFSAFFISEESSALYMATLMNDYNEEQFINQEGSWKGVR